MADTALVAVTEVAPAKVNLALHVTGRRADGYHLLDSLVVFAASGAADRITVRHGAGTLSVSGPRGAAVPTGPENLVVRAAAAMGGGVDIDLIKNLPAEAGIGGGSSDAAATLRAVAKLTGATLPAPEAITALGADVPVCLHPRAARMRGIGEEVTPIAGLPPLPALLVTPRVALSTPRVFAALTQRNNPQMQEMPAILSHVELADWLAAQRNDLEAPARALAPEIDTALHAIAATDGCLLSRMSGSGPTCFGLFAEQTAAKAAAARIAAAQPDWWVVAVTLH